MSRQLSLAALASAVALTALCLQAPGFATPEGTHAPLAAAAETSLPAIAPLLAR